MENKNNLVTTDEIIEMFKNSKHFNQLEEIKKEDSHLIVYASHLKFIIKECLKLNRQKTIELINNHSTLSRVYKDLYLDIIENNFNLHEAN